MVDSSAWDEIFITYTTEEQVIHHDGEWICSTCGAQFTSEEAAGNHCWENDDCFDSGYTGSPGWDEYVTVQVPHMDSTKREK